MRAQVNAERNTLRENFAFTVREQQAELAQVNECTRSLELL
jgi:hypothetical protein